MDKVSTEKRSENMAHIHGKDTKPEIIVRKYLFSRGLRYRKNYSCLPGHPDIVLPKYNTVVFVNGCFWHGHENCKFSSLPEKNKNFWEQKINSNKKRDIQIINTLESMGWKVIIVWTCQLKNKQDISDTLTKLYNQIAII